MKCIEFNCTAEALEHRTLCATHNEIAEWEMEHQEPWPGYDPDSEE